MQAATYTSLAECAYGEPFRFLFAVVSKGDKKASLIELPPTMMDQGHKRLKEQSERLIESLEQWDRGENIPGDWRTEVCVCD
jgi:Ni/Co efflux regulator RcnB